MFTEMDDTQARISAEIAKLIVVNNPVIITSNYKGIILTQPVRVLGIGPGQVILQAPEPKLCFALKEKIYLYIRELGQIVSARVLSLNTVMGKLELTDLSFTDWRWNERQSDRVQPRDPIYVYTEHKKALIRANLENLSVRGMSLMIYNYKEKALLIDRNSAVRLTLQLPGDNARLDLKGKIVHERQNGRLGIIGMQLMGNRAQEKHINRYVMARKAEILAELEQTSREFLDQQSMSCIYF